MRTLQQADKLAKVELARRERNITEFFKILSDEDLEMLAAADETNPRFEFVAGLCWDIEKAGGDLDAAIGRYQSEQII